MQNLTPQNLLVIVLLALGCLATSVLWQVRAEILQFFRASTRRYTRFSWPALMARIADDMSSDDCFDNDARNSGAPVAYQLETGSETVAKQVPNQFEALAETVAVRDITRTLTNAERKTRDIAYLATVRNEDGAYRYSANKIRDLVGGTAEEVHAEIRQYRRVETPPLATVPASGGRVELA